MANFEREAGLVIEVRNRAGALIDAIADAKRTAERAAALGGSFLDVYFQVGNPGADAAVTKQLVADAIASFNALHGSFTAGAHDTSLHKARS